MTDDADARLAGARTHKIRAIASSLAVQATFALRDVIQAATWATPTVFASYYLREISGLEGRLHTVGPCIAAGSEIR